MSRFKSYPTTCWLSAPPLEPQFPCSQTGRSTAPHTLNVDFTHRKHWWQRAQKPSLPKAGFIQTSGLQRGHCNAAEPRAQPQKFVLLSKGGHWSLGASKAVALRASRELELPGDLTELRMLGFAIAGGGRQAGRQLGCQGGGKKLSPVLNKPDPRFQAVLCSPWPCHYDSAQSAYSRWE